MVHRGLFAHYQSRYLYNRTFLNTTPTFNLRFREFWQRNPPVVSKDLYDQHEAAWQRQKLRLGLQGGDGVGPRVNKKVQCVTSRPQLKVKQSPRKNNNTE